MGDDGIDGIDEVSKDIKMPKEKYKVCFICEAKRAEFFIKGNPEDAYCKECAEDSFGDLEYLERL